MKANQCACGKAKLPEHCVCPTCWQDSPLDMRQAYTRAVDPTYRRELAKPLVDLARDRKPAFVAKPRQMQFVL